MATRPKAVIESRNGEKFSPITIAKNVLTDDGQNLHDILSDRKEDMMTPTIENSSSMFKVGQGDNVDYSSNVVNGAYESMVLKGKSMVNCIQEPSSQDVVLPYEFEDGQYVTINDTKESGAVGVELKGQTLVNIHKLTTPSLAAHATGWYENLVRNSGEIRFDVLTSPEGWRYINAGYLNYQMLKPNTKYLVVFESSQNISSIHFMRGDGLNGLAPSIVPVQNSKAIITTNSQIVANEQILYVNFRAEPNTKVSFKNPMIIEYQEGMENWDIPYFTGMTSCKMPILSTIGKNLFKYEGTINTKKGVMITFNNSQIDFSGTYTSDNLWNTHNLSTPITLRKGNYYYNLIGKGTQETVYFSTSDGTKLYTGRWTLDTDIKLSNIHIGLQQGKIYDGVTFKLQIEEGSTATTYEPYKSSILSLPEEVVLRSLPNGVRDTFNTRTGVYTQRIGEVFLNGSESWAYNPAATDKTLGLSGFSLSVTTTPDRKWYGTALCDKMPIITSLDKVGVYNGQGLNILIKSDSTNANTLKEILAKDPITVQYQLENPIVTKINLSSTLKSWNTTTHIYSEIPENTLYPILSHSNPSYPVILKPSTKYSIVANSYSNGHTNSAINFNLGGATVSTTVGNRVTTITTPSTLSNELLTMSGRGNKLNNVMVIEGDVVGDEPYFEGMCDSKSPILLNCGKNLAKLTRSYTSFGLTFKVIDDTLYVDGTAERILDYYLTTNNCENSKMLNSLEVGTMVTLSNSLGLRNFFGVWRNGTTDDSWFSNTMTIQNGDNNIRCFIRFDQGSTYNNQAIKIQLEATQNPTTYEPYKSNTTTFEQKDDKTIVLRSLPNGVKDTLNLNTGEYVQRVGERTFDGSEDELFSSHSSQNINKPLYRYICDVSDMKIISEHTDNTHLYCDKWATVQDKNDTSIGMWSTAPNVHRRIAHDRGALYFVVEGKNDVTQFREYLSQNPITVQYELATPIVKQINVEGYPYAYVNGHVLLESGSQEQSLTPTIEYSVVTNRNGQIRSNQKMVERHQKQLDRLQAMILTNLVNTQYEQTLTNLKYDLKNVREEVK